MKEENKGISVSKIRKKIHKDTSKHKEQTFERLKGVKKQKKNRNEQKSYFPDERYEYESDEIDFEKYISVIYRFKFLIFIIFILSTIIGLLYGSKVKLKYKASTKILIKEEPLEITMVNNKPVLKGKMNFSTWINILKSPMIASIAANLMDNKISSKTILSMIDVRVPPGKDSEKNTFTISAISTDPYLSAEVANKMYLALVEYETNKRKKEISRALSFLKNEIKAKQDSLSKIQKQINKLLFKNNSSMTISKNDINSLSIDQFNKFQEELSIAKIQLLVIKAKIKELKKRLKEEDNNIISQMTYSEPLKIKLMNLQVDLARALTKYTEKHPKVIEIKKNIENLKKMINKSTEEKIEFKNLSVNPVHQSLINKIIENETEKISLEQKIQALNQILSIKNKKSFNLLLNNLDAKKKALISLIADLQKRYNELNVNYSVEINRFEQINKAEIPQNPINKNKKRMTLVFSMLIGLMGGVLIAIILDKLDDRIYTIKEFTKKVDIPVIGTIPKMKFIPLDIINKEKENEKFASFMDTIFKDIYVNFKYMIVDENQNVFAVASSIKGEGKTLVSIMLAKLLAKEYSRILLIDTDFFIPKLSKIFGLQEKKGLSEIVSNQTSLDNSIIHIKEYNFDFIPSGKKPPNVVKFFSSGNFISILNKLKRDYDFIILDTAPILLIPECNNVFEHVDGILLITKILYTTYTQIRKTIKRLTLIKGEIMGIIFNFTRGVVIDKEYDNYSKYYYKKYYKNYKNPDNKEEKVKKENINKSKKSNKIIKKIISLFVFDDEEIITDEKENIKDSEEE